MDNLDTIAVGVANLGLDDDPSPLPPALPMPHDSMHGAIGGGSVQSTHGIIGGSSFGGLQQISPGLTGVGGGSFTENTGSFALGLGLGPGPGAAVTSQVGGGSLQVGGGSLQVGGGSFPVGMMPTAAAATAASEAESSAAWGAAPAHTASFVHNKYTPLPVPPSVFGDRAAPSRPDASQNGPTAAAKVMAMVQEAGEAGEEPASGSLSHQIREHQEIMQRKRLAQSAQHGSPMIGGQSGGPAVVIGGGSLGGPGTPLQPAQMGAQIPGQVQQPAFVTVPPVPDMAAAAQQVLQQQVMAPVYGGLQHPDAYMMPGPGSIPLGHSPAHLAGAAMAPMTAMPALAHSGQMGQMSLHPVTAAMGAVPQAHAAPVTQAQVAQATQAAQAAVEEPAAGPQKGPYAVLEYQGNAWLNTPALCGSKSPPGVAYAVPLRIDDETEDWRPTMAATDLLRAAPDATLAWRGGFAGKPHATAKLLVIALGISSDALVFCQATRSESKAAKGKDASTEGRLWIFTAVPPSRQQVHKERERELLGLDDDVPLPGAVSASVQQAKNGIPLPSVHTPAGYSQMSAATAVKRLSMSVTVIQQGALWVDPPPAVVLGGDVRQGECAAMVGLNTKGAKQIQAMRSAWGQRGRILELV